MPEQFKAQGRRTDGGIHKQNWKRLVPNRSRREERYAVAIRHTCQDRYHSWRHSNLRRMQYSFSIRQTFSPICDLTDQLRGISYQLVQFSAEYFQWSWHQSSLYLSHLSGVNSLNGRINLLARKLPVKSLDALVGLRHRIDSQLPTHPGRRRRDGSVWATLERAGWGSERAQWFSIFNQRRKSHVGTD